MWSKHYDPSKRSWRLSSSTYICFGDRLPRLLSVKPRSPKAGGLSLSMVPLINGLSAASRRSIRPTSFQHTSQLPHQVTEHTAQDGGDYDEEERI
jgi:hypothetical protein